MLELSECRQYLDPEYSEKLSDEELAEIRDALYELADLMIDTVD